MRKKEQLVFKHIFADYMTWSIWFLAIMVIVHIISVSATAYFSHESITWSILATATQSTHVFILIIGIMNMGGILSYLASNGVTRRDYFFGTSKAAILIGITLATVSLLLVLGETLLFTMFGWEHIETITFSSLFTTFISLVLRLPLFFFIGWLISAGFYRFHWLLGMVFIFIGIVYISVSDFVWGDLGISTFDFLPERDLSVLLAVVASIVLIGLTLYLLRLLTKQVRVKV